MRALESLSRRFRRAVFAARAGVDPAGAAAAGAAAAGLLLDPLGAAAGRADRVRPAVPLVCRARHGRPGVGRDDLHQEPRPPAGGRGGGEVPGRGAGAAQGQAAVVERALLGRRHAAGGLGQPEELPARRTASGDPPGRWGATASATSAARSGATTRMPRPPTPTRGSTARAGQGGASSASWATR